MRVLHCVPSLHNSDGGPAQSVPSLAAAEAAAGADVRICTGDMPTIDLSQFTGVGFVAGEPKVVTSHNWIPDLIHDHGIWLRSNHLSARLSRQKRIPRIVSPRGMLEPWCMKHHRFRKKAAWQLYQQRDLQSCAGLHATSDAEVSHLRSLGLTQPVVLLPNGVSSPPPENQPEKSLSNNQPGKREVIFLSRIHPKKGIINLVNAWKQIACDEWLLRIVGSDEANHRKEVENAINENGLQNCVVINDAVYSNKKWDLLRKADVMILPSFSENFGIVVAESLSVGTPVITTTETPWEKVLTKNCGWYTEPSVPGIVQALRAAMLTPKVELLAMGRRGQEWIGSEFSWNDIGQRMLGGYDWILGRRQACDFVKVCSELRKVA